MKRDSLLSPVHLHMQMNGQWDAQASLQEMPKTGRSKAAQVPRLSITSRHACQMESQHCYGTLDLLEIWPAMHGYANMPLWLYGLDCDLKSDAESVLSQSEALEKGGEKCTHNCILPVTLLNT